MLKRRTSQLRMKVAGGLTPIRAFILRDSVESFGNLDCREAPVRILLRFLETSSARLMFNLDGNSGPGGTNDLPKDKYTGPEGSVRE